MMRQNQFIDPAQLARIADMEVLARSIVAGLSHGLHRSAHTGASVEFAQYRPYTQGDDPRFVDWRLYGRTDRLHIKQFQKETNLRCTIALDCSASMKYGSAGVTKFQYGKMLTACLAYLLCQQGDAVAFVGYHERVQCYLPPRVGPRHLRRVLTDLYGIAPSGSTNTEGTLRFAGAIMRTRGMFVLISDLLHPLDATLSDLRSLRAQRHDVLVLQITDPAERDFPFEDAVTLVDFEDAREQHLLPGEIRAQYLENRTRHFDRIRRECLNEEIDIEEFVTDRPLEYALHYFLRRRHHVVERTSRVRKHGARGL